MENNDLFKHYFDVMPCFLSVQDRDYKIIQANQRFHKSFGEWEGRYCYQVYKQRPEKCENCPVERTFHDGQQHRSEEFVKTLGGRDLSVIVYTTPIKNEEGEITAVMEMSTDITAIKHLQHQLKDSQVRYRQLFEDVPCFISMQDKDLNIIEANKYHRDAFGTFYGCKCYKVYKNREKACDPCVVLKTFEDGQTHVHEEVVTNQEGERLNVMVTTAPVIDADGNIESVIEMSADITQIRQLQSKLSSVGMIISSISHDLKGLLNGMNGGIYLVNTGIAKDDNERMNKGWEMVLRNVDRIRSTVLDILYYAKDRQPEWEPIKSDSLVDEVFEILKQKAADHNIIFEKDVNDNAGEFEADSKALRSLLVNLLDNSFDACRVDQVEDKPKVKIMAHGSDDEVVFEIVDNGIGMNKEVIDKAFTLFFSSKGSGGTGLGLFIANKIAKAHGGSINVSSTVGEGARFVIKFPRVKPDNLPIIEEPEEDNKFKASGA